jgi:hypothetical protein
VVALGGVGAHVGERGQRRRVLDALGDDADAERASQLDGRADDREVDVVRRELRDERAVDLELVDGQPLEVGQRRVARPVVVDRDLDPRRGELGEDERGLVGRRSRRRADWTPRR